MKSKCVSYVRRDSPRSLPIAARFKPLWTPGWEGLSLDTRSAIGRRASLDPVFEAPPAVNRRRKLRLIRLVVDSL
jgi:hypothetical protein